MDEFYEQVNFKKYSKKQIKILLFEVIFLMLIFSIPLIYAGVTFVFTNTEAEMMDIVDGLVDDSMNDTQKVDALLTWFDRGGSSLNFTNIYHRNKDEIPLLKFGILYIYDKEPYFCARFLNNDDPKWIISSRCGMCGETSSLFRRMGEIAGLNVSEIHCDAEDHVWNEVYVSGQKEPLVIDATAVDSSKNNSTGYELYDFMEDKVAKDQRNNKENPKNGNVSFVYATFHDESKRFDVTEQYTQVINLTVNVSNPEGEPLPDCTVRILSYNRPGKYGRSSWGLKNTTNESGQCTFSLGGGRYKFELKHEDDWFSTTSKKVEFWENESGQYHNLTYESKSIIGGLIENPQYIFLILLFIMFIIALWNDWKGKK